MSNNDPVFKTKFLAFTPQMKVLSGAQGGGFQIILDVPESEWEKVADINHPGNKRLEFTATLEGRVVR